MQIKNIFILFVACTGLVRAQEIERKIIIEKGIFYFTTVDPKFQIATLHTGKLSDTLSKAKRFALPVGRNYNEPVNPFCWDLSGTTFYAVNFLNHPMNDRNEALKSFSLSSLQEWDSTITITDMVLKSVDQNIFAYNDPYLFTIKRSNILNDFYFDIAAINDSSYYMVIANNGELTTWKYNGREWKQGKIQSLPVNGYFNLFVFKQHLYLHLNSGAVYEVTIDTVSPISLKKSLSSFSDGLVIVDRDNNTIQFVKRGLADQNISLNELIEKKAVKLL